MRFRKNWTTRITSRGAHVHPRGETRRYTPCVRVRVTRTN